MFQVFAVNMLTEERAFLGGESSPLCEPMAKGFCPNAQFGGLFHGQEFAGIPSQDLSWMKSRDWTSKLVGDSLSLLLEGKVQSSGTFFGDADVRGVFPCLSMLKASILPAYATSLCMLQGVLKALLRCALYTGTPLCC